MASEASQNHGAGKKLQDINVTGDELAKFSKALKDEGFRKLLGEYVEEIQDPENRKRYEEEIALLEQERGYDVTWIHPQPSFVLKLQTEAAGKAFINVCSNGHVGAPSCAPTGDPRRRGLNWSIPYAQSRPREDQDKAGARCTVYDVVFHPDTLYMAGKNPQMRRLVEETAVQAVDEAFKAGLKRSKVAYPKLKYKGVPQASIVRRRRADAAAAAGDSGDDASLQQAVIEKLRREAADLTLAEPAAEPAQPADAGYETPEHTLLYRDHFDMQQFATRCGGAGARPQALVVRVLLPKLASAAGLDLDVGAQTLKLRSESGQAHRYRLELVLPLPVDDKGGSATFDRSARALVVTLPVRPAPADCIQDSGIDSDCAKNESDDDAYRTARGGGQGDAPGGDADGGVMMLVEKEPAAADTDGPAASEPPAPAPAEPPALDPAAASAPTPAPVPSLTPTSTAISAVQRPTPPRLYSLPQYKLEQDATSLHLLLTEPNLERDSVRVTRAGAAALDVTVTSVGAGMTPLYFRLRLALPAEVGKPAVRFADDCVTVSVEKRDGDWACCHIGADECTLAEVLVPWKLEDPAAAAGAPARSSASASSLGSVTSYEGPLSVTSQSSVDELSQKKSILKKRYGSESSADEVFTPGSSLLSSSLLHVYDEADEARAKKAVRFSDRVLEKRYRSTSTILHDLQRTERQRLKKKRQRAARRHSEGDTSENDEFRSPARDGAAVVVRPQPVVRRSSSDGDTSENDEYQSSATDGSTGAMVGKQGAKKRKNKRKQDRKQKDLLNNELMFDLDM
ncbi:protein kintoun-like [Pollicipes pollicipes]|uniref:protein kintoun-like n=1 Tax=Pollicipes pollicipes TaxID=41117 RepID=UPI0018850166|nr:protein kintoun-like [Pollicipes pollicipes]